MRSELSKHIRTIREAQPTLGQRTLARDIVTQSLLTHGDDALHIALGYCVGIPEATIYGAIRRHDAQPHPATAAA